MTNEVDPIGTLLELLAEALAPRLDLAHKLPTGGMTKAEAIKELGLTRTQVESLMDEGEISYLRVGKRIVISRASVEGLLRMGGDFSHVERTRAQQGRAG